MSERIPEGWEFKQLGDYVLDSAAGEWGNEAAGDQNDIPVLRSTNFTESGVIDYAKLAFRNIEEKKRIKKALQHGDILLEKSGGSPTQPVGRVVYFDRHTPHLYSNFTQKLVPIKECDSKYLFYKLYHEYQIGTVLKFQQQTTGIINFQLAEYLGFKTQFAPLLEQKKIAAILSSVDKVIEKTRAQIDKLKDLKTGMMQELLTKGIGHTEFKDSPVGRIPNSWEVHPLGDVCDLQVGYAFKSTWFSETGVKLLRGDNVGYGTPTWERTRCLPEEKIERFQDYLLNVGDLIIGMDRTFTKSGTKLSKLSYSDVPALLVQRVGRFVPERIQKNYLWHLLRSTSFTGSLKVEEKGMDIPHLSKSEILAPLIVLPPLEEQHQIAAALTSVDDLLATKETKWKSSVSLKKALMQDLLTGKVRVQVDAPETAEA